MPADTAHWLELKEFDQCEPSALAFRALVALLDTWSAEDQAAAIEYADKLLSKWPDAVRLAPWSWCKAASKGAVLPTWPLVRALQLTPNHLSKGTVDLARLARHAKLEHITELEIPFYSDFQELSFLYHHPETFPALKKLRAADKYDDGEVRALAHSPLWRTLETFEIEYLTDSLVHRKDASRIVPQLDRPSRIRHLTLRPPDLIAVWDANRLPKLRSASVFIRSIKEARALAARAELSQLTSLSIAFRCGFSGSSPFEPFLGNIIEADEAAANAFFHKARLDRLEKLAIVGYSMGYWGREGLGRHGLKALIASDLLQRLKHLRLELLPLGDKGVAALAPALGKQLQTLELVNVYCKGDGAAALIDSPCLSSLRHLDLSANRIDAEHVVRMADVAMPHLQSLDLSGPSINPYYWNIGQQPLLDKGAAAWANSKNAKHLKRLRLQNCYLTDEALTAIFQSSRLRNLEQLDLSHNSFTASAIAQAAVGSPLWQTLKELGLNNCRLDNAAMEGLSRVDHAPALRSLQLDYNSIGPKGAAALARWSVLANVWHLELHDNVIGDEGLIALAKSPNLSRLLELDLEQDCWNSRTFTFNNDAVRALAASRSLLRLDSLFSGCVDEYHGTAYSPGFTKVGLAALRKAEWMRLACKAACGDFSGVSDYFEPAPFNEEAELSDHDFRRHPPTLNDKEAKANKHRMQQVRAASAVEQEFDEEKPPEIRPSLPELDRDEEDVIEGLEFRDTTPATDISLRLNLSLEDCQRPLPKQVGKLLSDTLRSIFNACSLGYFEATSAGSREDKNGRRIDTDVGFSIGIKGDPQPAVQLIRETLWWIGAPGDTELDKYPLALTKKPASTASRFLQLAAPKITRWQFQDEPDYRIDRVPFSPTQRERIQRILAEVRAVENAEGWAEVATSDGGRMAIYIKYLNDSAGFDTLNILVDVLTSEISGLVHKLMQEGALMLLPMAFAASGEVAGTIDCDWPKVKVVPSAATLHKLLARGPYHWWRQTATKSS
jgi:Ran GTPase-activating protein (RanGAP) involved in mRNA processing and transport